MNSTSFKTYLGIVMTVLGFIAIFGLSNFLAKNRMEIPESYSDEDLALQGDKLKGYSFGFEGLIADWYWMRSLQYIGYKIGKADAETTINLEDLNPLGPRLLYPLLNSATDLDPKFLEVYSYGAIVLPAIDRQQAIAIIEKGIENNPDEWRLYQHLGFIYWRLKDYKKAAEVYEKGANINNAPGFLRLMAAKMQSDAGSRETARQIYQQMFDQAKDTKTRENARFRLLELDSLAERDAIRNALGQLKAKKGRCASSLGEILPLLRNVKLPDGKDFRIDDKGNIVDPTDAPYILDAKKCDVRLDFEKTKLPRR